jgi:hypothetical protein
VVATVFLDWGLSFGAGLLFAMAGRSGARELRFRSPAFRWGLAYLHLGVIAISVVLYALQPDWMWMYWVDASTLPVAVHIVAFVVYELCFLAGFTLGAELSAKAAWGLAGLDAIAISATEFAARTRLFHLGTFDEFAAGRAPAAIATDPFRVEAAWWIVTVAGGISMVALIVVLRKLHLQGRGVQTTKAPAAANV